MKKSTVGESLPLRLRTIRRARRLSQTALAREAGIVQGSVSNYEAGKRKVSLATAMQLAAALDITLSDLVDIDEDRLIIPGGSRLAAAAALLEASPQLLDSVLSRAEQTTLAPPGPTTTYLPRSGRPAE